MLKILGLMLIISATYLAGNSFAIRLLKRKNALNQMAQLCSSVCEQIRLFATPVEQIVCECEKKYNTLIFLKDYPKIEPEYPFTKEDAAVIVGFFKGLGKSDTSGQQKHCTAYELQFKRLAEEAQDECAAKNRLYRILGLFCGICIAVLVV